MRAVAVDAEDAVATKVGVGFRRQLAEWLLNEALSVNCLEITADHFFNGGRLKLEELSKSFEIYVHGLNASLGTPGKLDRRYVEKFAEVVKVTKAKWISEHIAFTRVGNTKLGHLNPVRPTRENAALIAEHAMELAKACNRQIILENITSHVQLPGDLTEPEFLNEICERGNCGLLLDVTNLYINSRNHGYDPLRWLDALNTGNVVQAHIVGYSENNGHLEDNHEVAVQPELLDLLGEVASRSNLKSVILERDHAFDDTAALQTDIDRIKDVVGRY